MAGVPRSSAYGEPKRRVRLRQAGQQHADRPARLIEGQRTIGWREALTELETAYPGRIR